MACGGCSVGCSDCVNVSTNPVYSPIKARSLVINPGDTVRLGFLFRGPDGEPQDTDLFPSVSIIQPTGGVIVGPTTQGVFRTGVGEYGFTFAVGLNPLMGVWRDVWEGTIDGFKILGEGSFQVSTTMLPATNTDGYKHLGDDPGFCYSQEAVCNINNILKALRRRLKSSGYRRSCDAAGNIIYEQCDIFSVDELVTFIAQSLTMFNEIPTFTFFTFEDTPIIEMFFDVLVQGATYLALAAQALIERGGEFAITDNGIGFTPPTMSELLNSQYTNELANWYEKIKLIKMNMRPAPQGLGTLRPLAVSSQLKRLRWLRARQII